ncbi:hypothetical protein EIP91_006307 [Steccherinum ochraceum]|uniref:3'-5' exonuclease domain-containing protein n=1 Tax=Steccherinum ochraceum TaxID=92696 RepID=A0A4R0RMF0_9APHY|nr:hypothetical protein EIP91_006307 [Steccherinum ochraceum]
MPPKTEQEPAKPEPMAVQFTYVENYNQLPKVVQKLSRSSHLILDCEGQSIGSPEGILSLISVGTAGSKEIFVLDVLRLHDRTHPLLRPFLLLLQNPTVLKIVWDGRMDFAEILATYGVPLRGLLDLQIAEVVSRAGAREEQEYQRRGRLRRVFDKEITMDSSLRPLMRDFHVVAGLQGIIRECKIVENLAKDDEVVAMHKDGNSSFWLNRPLPPNLCAYAAADIKLISLTYDFFIRKAWITAANHATLVCKSTRYTSYFDSREKRQFANDMNVARLLPLDVVHEPEPTQYQCYLCMRMLNLGCFETLVTAPAPAPAYTGGRRGRGGSVQSRREPAGRPVPSHRRPCCRICAMCAKAGKVVIATDWLTL